MPTDNRYFTAVPSLSFFLVLSCAFGVDSVFGQKSRTSKKETPVRVEILRNAEVVPPPTVDELAATIRYEPCKGEQPGNVLGISEQSQMPERVAGFIKKLRESDPKARACAARQLGYLGPDSENALPYLIRLLYEEKDTNVWSNIEYAIWAIGPGRETHDVAESTRNRLELLEMIGAPDVQSRFYAAFALGYYRPLPEQKAIVRALISATKDQDQLVRSVAIKGLGRLGRFGPLAREAVPALIEILRGDSQSLQKQSIIALTGIGPEATEAVPVLLDHLYQGDYDVTTVSAIALARIGPIVLPLLKQELKSHPLSILKVLNHIGVDAAPLVIDALEIPDNEVRKKDMGILQSFGHAAEPAVPLLVNALKDPDKEVRQQAAWTLETIGPPARAAVPALIAALHDKDEFVQCSAAEALASIGPAAKSAAPKLVQQMKSTIRPRSDFRQKCAAAALMKMSSETRALVPPRMIKVVEEWDAMMGSTFSSPTPDPTRPKPKTPPKPTPRSY